MPQAVYTDYSSQPGSSNFRRVDAKVFGPSPLPDANGRESGDVLTNINRTISRATFIRDTGEPYLMNPFSCSKSARR